MKKDFRFAERIKAFSIHLLASALLAAIMTIPLVVWLYPSPFFEAAGGLYLVAMIVGIDVIVGPLLTFVAYDTRKASLKKDLRIIVALQLIALGYGLYATAMSRPVFMTYVVDRFEMLSYAEVEPEELARAKPEFRQLNWGHPGLAYTQRPENQEERNAILLASASGALDLKHFLRYYQPFAQARSLVAERAQPLSKLSEFNSPQAVEAALAPLASLAAGSRRESLAFVPVVGKRRDLTAVVDPASGALVKVIDLRPWK